MKLPCLPPVLLALVVCLPGLRAAEAPPAPLQPGVRLLETELLPSDVTLRTAKCDQLVIAVGKTTLDHPGDALSILHAALTRGVVKKKDHGEGTAELLLPCACARRIFLASVAAAPKRASDILDLATLFYPDCTPEFAAALQEYEASGEGGGFGVGFGPGYPGAPGFGGAPAGSSVSSTGPGIAAPPSAVTVVVNG